MDLSKIIDSDKRPLIILDNKGKPIYKNKAAHPFLKKKALILKNKPKLLSLGKKTFALTYRKHGKFTAIVFDDIIQNESIYAEFDETYNIGLYKLDLKGKFQYVNQGFAKIFGYKTNEILKWKDWSPIIPKESIKHARESFRALVSGKLVNSDILCRGKDGKEIWVSFGSTPIKRSGKIISIAGVLVDRTKKKKAEEAMKMFKTSFDTSPNSGLIVEYKNSKPSILNVNSAYTKYYGYAESEVLGKNPNIVQSGKHPKSFYRKLWKDILNPKKGFWSGEIINKTKKGKLIPTLLTINTIFEGKKPALFVASHVDLTKIKSIEKDLEAERDFLRSSKKQLEKVLFSLQKETEMLLTGSAKLKNSLNYAFDPKDFHELKKVAERLNSLVSSLHEKEKLHSDYIKNMKTSMNQLSEVEELKTNFLSIASHELKTPLTPIIAQTEILLNRSIGHINEEQKESLELILRNVKRLATTINNVAQASKQVRGKISFNIENCKMKEIIASAVHELYYVIKSKNVSLEVQTKEIPQIRTDKDKIEHIITNLIENAVKFNKQGGKVWVAAEKFKKGKENYIKVSIKDTGIGIPREKQFELFKPFYQVNYTRKRKYGGTGLGLNICKYLVDVLGGQIWLKSREGKGSTFYFIIPLKSKIKEPEMKPMIFEQSGLFERLAKKGLITEDGKIMDGINVKDLEDVVQINYKNLIIELIIEARKLIKGIAITRANLIDNLSVSNDEVPAIKSIGDPKKTFNLLLISYGELLGDLVKRIEEDLVSNLLKEKLRQGGG